MKILYGQIISFIYSDGRLCGLVVGGPVYTTEM
jgi:hypothetical protein